MEERLDSFSNDSFRARAAALLAFGQRRLAAGGWARYGQGRALAELSLSSAQDETRAE